MSKYSLLILGLTVGGLMTAMTYFVSHNNSKINCTPYLTGAAPQSIQWQMQYEAAHPPIQAHERGFPLAYYREAFPANCFLAEGVNSKTGWILSGLVLDYLIWSVLVIVVCSAPLLIKKGKA